ncbi:hypothetical protein [Neogemmobacter tilapiae]|uniref:Uncharacterized protein n=1 Tax=Neogemmobacter tilapiae TaxID=875041 RepID=A0A918WJY5_9RHOB|nr:hypothetical protein [Gemmobacter tilapiae]GHC49742.1 hypothetical protein GCM10007315_09930 [Gemmobacter tilapiae]
MFLFFQSIPFSLAVFWRFLIVFPFILVPAFVIIAGTALIFPPVALLLTAVVYNFWVLVGIRAGLGAQGYGNGPDFFALVRWAFVFTLFQTAYTIFLGALVWALVTGASMLGYSELAPLLSPHALQDWWGLLTGAPLLAGSAAAFWLISTALWSMSLVPQAAAAWSSTTKAPPTNLFSGFGAGFFGLFLVTTASTALILWTRATDHMLMFFARLIKWAIDEYTGLLELPPTVGELLPGLLGMLLWVWASCWVFGAAALAFIHHRRRVERAALSRGKEIAPPTDDIRNLRQARERAQQGLAD